MLYNSKEKAETKTRLVTEPVKKNKLTQYTGHRAREKSRDSGVAQLSSSQQKSFSQNLLPLASMGVLEIWTHWWHDKPIQTHLLFPTSLNFKLNLLPTTPTFILLKNFNFSHILLVEESQFSKPEIEEKPCLPCIRQSNITKIVKKKNANCLKCYCSNPYKQKQMYFYLGKGFIKVNA